jgi:hypothetical protein
VNCSSHIVTRFTEAELEGALLPCKPKSRSSRLRTPVCVQPSQNNRHHRLNESRHLPDSYIRGILNTVKTIAVVGISPKDNRQAILHSNICASEVIG